MTAPRTAIATTIESISVLSRVVAWWNRQKQARRDALVPERLIDVRSDDQRITATYPDGAVQSIRWNQIDRVTIETNDSGPWGADLWWVLEGAGLRCTYPDGASGCQEALAAFRRQLAGFDDAAVSEAMRTTTNAHFLCWEQKLLLAPDGSHRRDVPSE